MTDIRNGLRRILGFSAEPELVKRARPADGAGELAIQQQTALGLPNSAKRRLRALRVRDRKVRSRGSRATAAHLKLHLFVERPENAVIVQHFTERSTDRAVTSDSVKRRHLIPRWIGAVTSAVVLGVDFLFFLGLWRDELDASGWLNTVTLSAALMALITPLMVFSVALPLGTLTARTVAFKEQRSSGRYAAIGALLGALIFVCTMFEIFSSFRFQQDQGQVAATAAPTLGITLLFTVLPAVAALVHCFSSDVWATEHSDIVRAERLRRLHLRWLVRRVLRARRRQDSARARLNQIVQVIFTESDLAVNRGEMLIGQVRAEEGRPQLTIREDSASESGRNEPYAVPSSRPVTTTDLLVPARIVRLVQQALDTLATHPAYADAGSPESVERILALLEPKPRLHIVRAEDAA